MPALLRRPLKNAVMFFTFRKIRKPTTRKKRHQEESLVFKREENTSAKTGSKIYYFLHLA
jgi:hypothetical protein